MKPGRQPVYLGDSSEALLRVVSDRNTDLRLGIETGVVSHRRNEIPVWRPANPFGIGLDQSWRDGHWRNLYEAKVAVAPAEQSGIYDRGPVEVAGFPARLPVVRFTETLALRRFLRQQLR
jgi:hypothetical protein